MPKNETEKQYNELRKKHKLPEFKDIDFEFEISDLEETNFLLRAIIRRIAEKLDFYSTMLEEVLQPDTSNLYAMHEMKFFSLRQTSRKTCPKILYFIIKRFHNSFPFHCSG